MSEVRVFNRRLDKPVTTFLMLRLAWIGWLAALVALFAYPVALLEVPSVHELVVILHGSAGVCVRDDCAPESWLVSHQDWTLFDLTDTWHIWLPLLVALSIPLVIHGRRQKRLGPVFHDWPRGPNAFESQTYRSKAPSFLRGRERPFVAHVRAFFGRMSLSMMVCALPFYALFQTRLIKNYGCVSYTPLCSVLEYFIYAGLMLVVVFVHAPTVHRVFGNAAREYEMWRRDGSVWHEEAHHLPRD